MSDKRLQSFDTGSRYDFRGGLDKAKVPSSVFNLSHGVAGTFPAQSFGKLVPILCERLLPNDKGELSVDTLLRALPTEIPIYSKQRVTFHAFVALDSDLWANAEVYHRKGNTGNVILKKPTLSAISCPNVGDNDLVTNGHLLHYLYGLPIGSRIKDYFGKIDLLPLVMYNKIWCDSYMNRNLYMDNKVVLPDDWSRWRVDDTGLLLSAKDNGQQTFDFLNYTWRDYPDDRFIGSFPSPQRGDAPTLSYALRGFIPIQSEDGKLQGLNLGMTNGEKIFLEYDVGGTTSYSEFRPGNLRVTANSTVPTSGTGSTRLGVQVDGASLGLDIQLNDIRRLAAAQTELERMAKTDGSYAEFGLTFFNRVSRNARNFKTTFIGGTYKDILYSEVIQTTPTDTSPLGAYAGHGIMSIDHNKGSLGRLDMSDYGYIMVLMSVMPDVYYSQGVKRSWTCLTQAQEYLPDRVKMGMQPILNKEVFYSGNSEVDDDVFSYEDPFTEYKAIPNRVVGKFADPSCVDFFQYTQSRYFAATPTYSQDFFTTFGNVRQEYLTAPTECPFTFECQFQWRHIHPLPYRSDPAKII